jgi:hypothetical protein
LKLSYKNKTNQILTKNDLFSQYYPMENICSFIKDLLNGNLLTEDEETHCPMCYGQGFFTSKTLNITTLTLTSVTVACPECYNIQVS